MSWPRQRFVCGGRGVPLGRLAPPITKRLIRQTILAMASNSAIVDE
jgi:hypothetical protein